MTITLPGSNSAKTFIQSVPVTFKAKSGEYDYWNGTEAVRPKKIKGIVVGSGFQFITTKIATKKKTLQYVSAEFGWDVMKEGEIPMRELVRETGKDFSSASYGKKTYAQWKEEGMRPAKIVYVLSSEDNETVYKLTFSGKSFMDVSKFITPDIPNFIVEFGISETAEETDNGDFYSPTFVKVGPINAIDESTIMTHIKEIDAILNKKEPVTLNVANEVFEGATKDIPF